MQLQIEQSMLKERIIREERQQETMKTKNDMCVIQLRSGNKNTDYVAATMR